MVRWNSAAVGRTACIAVLSVCISACADFEKRQHLSDEAAIRAWAWTEPDPIPFRPYYCYRTLGEVDCLDRPDPREHARREGWPHLGEDGAATTP